MGVNIALSPHEKALLKAADFLEACFTVLDQRLLGNRTMDIVWDRLDCHEQKTHCCDCNPKLKEMYFALRGVYQEISADKGRVFQAVRQLDLRQ
jgi:hypothetical protein